jgi:hypothetical protein
MKQAYIVIFPKPIVLHLRLILGLAPLPVYPALVNVAQYRKEHP